MKTNPHTKPQSHEGNPSQRSATAISPLRAPAPLREFPLPSSFPVSAFRSPVSSSPTHSPAEAQSRREIPQGAWASRPPSTPGRDGSPQPSQTSGATRRHEGRLRLKNGASRRSAPTLVSLHLPIRVHPFPFAGQRSPLRASAQDIYFPPLLTFP